MFLRERTLNALSSAMKNWDPNLGGAPPGGWIRAIRLALGMTSRQLALRAMVSQSTLEAAQRAESERTVSLRTLDRYAAALDCRVAYALIPLSGSLLDVRPRRASLLAHHRVQLDPWRERRYVERALLFGNPARLWSEAEVPVFQETGQRPGHAR